jgi:hypothetical protein
LLDSTHAGGPRLDAAKESGVAARHIAVNDIFVNERAVSDPGVAIGMLVRATRAVGDAYR